MTIRFFESVWVALICILPVTGCATRERLEAQAQCSAEAMSLYPPRIEQRMVNKTRPVKVQTGDMKCTTVGNGSYASTNCIAATRTEYVPYIAVENVDVNKLPRDEAENACADRLCYQRHGNVACETE
ncbi:hypothetical protein [Propionivibrio sp.]|uniref:hypothetical protein n=1 Tax=Propionivibrio sp. TaxID=2212460 RepID=UPI00272E6204|nr:hypothetical protein [Propionivibrio sp.]